MYSLKGFIKLKDLVNNTPGIVSPLGELSTFSTTYSKEKGEYDIASAPDVKLVSFQSTDSILGLIPVGVSYSAHTLQIAQSLYSYSKSLGLNATHTDLLNHLLSNFASTINNLEAGPLVVGHQIHLPEWISWNNPALAENRIKIWFSDSAFKRQYDEFEIIVIPPVDDLNDLFKDFSIADSSLLATSPSGMMEKLHAVKAGNPETVIRAETFLYQNVSNGNYTKEITWYVVVYGQGGDNSDAIREAIIEYNNTNSEFEDSEWRIIVPDLYKVTEFTIVPNWLRQAIPEKTVQAGIYSPIMNINQVVNEFKANFPDFDETHLNENLQSFIHPYKSISLLSLGGETNKANKFKVTDYFPDYASFGTPSPDFNRMSKATQEWSYVMEELLIIAEKDNQYSDLPVNVRRVIRDGKTFVVRNLNGVQFLVYSKSNVSA